jgi:hypothetical protein
VKSKLTEEVNSNNDPTESDTVRTSVLSNMNDATLISKWISSIYHMISTMDGLYEQILGYYEGLRSELRNWLSALFPKAITLPIADPENVKSIMSCMIKENMLLEQATLDSLQQAISNSIFKGLMNENNVLSNRNRNADLIKQYKQQLSHRTLSFYDVISPIMKNILMTLQYIIGDYVLIFPSDIPIMSYFQSQSYEIWEKLIKPFYRELANHNSIESLPSSPPSALSMSINSSITALSTNLLSSFGSSTNSFFCLLEIYLFLEKYILLIDKFGSSKDSLIHKLKEKKAELTRSLNTSLISDLKQKIKSLSNESGGFQILGDVEYFQDVSSSLNFESVYHVFLL